MKKIFLLAILSVLLMAGNALAAFSISSATINPSETVTTRESIVTISVILEAGDATSATVSIDSNAISPYLSCVKCSETQNPSTNPTYELQVTPQQAKADGLTFTVTATPNTGNTATTDKTIYINNPPTLSLNVSSSVSSVVSGDTVIITLTVSNTGGSDATGASAVITAASGFTLTGGTATAELGTIAAGGSATTSWTYTASSPSSSNAFSVSVTDNEGSDTTSSLSITGPTTTTTTPAGGGTVTMTVERTHTWSNMTPEEFSIMKVTGNISFKQIQVKVKQEATNVKLTVSKLSAKPSNVTDVTGTVYQYINITKTNLEDNNIDSVKIMFNVSKTWLNDNGFASGDVFLKRYYNDTWETVTIRKMSENGDVEYEAQLSGLSVFAILAEKASTTTTVPTTTTTIPPAICGNGVCESGETTESCPQDCPAPSEYGWIILVIIIIVCFVLFVYKYRHGKPIHSLL